AAGEAREGREGGRRRRRGGRGGRERGERHESAQGNGENAPQPVSAPGNNGAGLDHAPAAAMASSVEAEPVQTHEQQIPHVTAPSAPYEMTRPLMEEPAAIEHQAEPAPVVERVVEHVPVEPAVIAPAVPVAREPIVLPSDLEQV